jgi:hypothetical protein
MRRIEMVLALAAAMAMMLALMAGPALAQTDIPPPGPGTPGNPQTPTTNTATPTPTVGKNCNGQAASNFLKGPGPSFSEVSPTGEPIGQPFPGSAAQPVTFGGQQNFNGPATSSLAPGQISDIQQANRDAAALCRATR